MKKIVFGYNKDGGFEKTTFFENDLNEMAALILRNYSKVGDHIEVLGGPKISVPQVFNQSKLDIIVSLVSEHFECPVEYNQTSLLSDKLGPSDS